MVLILYCHPAFLIFSVGVGSFVIGLSQISSFFSICVQLVRALIYLQRFLIELESFTSAKELSDTANMTVKWESVGIRELPYSSEEFSNTITELFNSFKDKLN